MTPAEFARRRAKIEHTPGKSKQWRERAMRRLLNEARAVVVVSAGKAIGWQLIGGKIVCVKERYKNEDAAELQLKMIRAYSSALVMPQRAYHCPHCHGFHLTSRA